MAYRENAFSNLWIQLGNDIDGEAASDQFGYSISVSSDGTIVAVGATNHTGNTPTGQVRVFQYSNSSWSQLGNDIDGDTSQDKFGYSVSLSSDGTIVAIGAINNDSFHQNGGEVKVYQYSSGSWTQLGNILLSDAEALENFGYSVSLSSDGTIVAAGGPGWGSYPYSSDAGHVRVYQYSDNSWNQLGDSIGIGDGSYDYSGRSVSLSSDGTIVAVGIPSPARIGKTSSPGYVRVYQYDANNTSWSQLGSDINGEANDDEFGYSISLSSDGTILAVGAPYNDGNGSSSGHVRIYQYSNSSWSQLGSDINGEASNDNAGISVSLDASGIIVAVGNSGNGSKVSFYQYDASNNWSQLGSDINDNGSKVSLSSDGTIVAIGGSNTAQMFNYATVPNYNICFPGNTPVATDQGIVPIKKINTNFHTIRNMSIQDITKSVLYDKYVVCFKANSLGENIPSQDTYISKNHMVFFKGEYKPAYLYVNYDNIVKTKYNGELMYNVLLDNHNKMLVNNLVCETLDPDNTMAKLNNLLKQLPRERQRIVIKEFNEHIKNNHIDNKKSKADFVINI